MALLNIFTVALLFAGHLRVDAVNMCQVCMSTPLDKTLAIGDPIVFDKFIENQGDKLCADDTTTIKNTDSSEMVVRASLQVLIPNPDYCYFQFKFGSKTSAVNCLVSGYNITGGHYTHGSCEAMGKLAANDLLTVVVAYAQCNIRSNYFVCLSALQIPA